MKIAECRSPICNDVAHCSQQHMGRSEVSEPRSAPTVGQVVLGRRLQDLRERAGLRREEAAKVLRVAPATIRRMEMAEVSLKIPYVVAAAEGVRHRRRGGGRFRRPGRGGQQAGLVAALPRHPARLVQHVRQPGGRGLADQVVRAALRARAAADRGVRPRRDAQRGARRHQRGRHRAARGAAHGAPVAAHPRGRAAPVGRHGRDGAAPPGRLAAGDAGPDRPPPGGVDAAQRHRCSSPSSPPGTIRARTARSSSSASPCPNCRTWSTAST